MPLKIFSTAGEFLREILDTHGRIMTFAAITIACGGGALVTAVAQASGHIHGWFLAAVALLSVGVFIILAGLAVKSKTSAVSPQAATDKEQTAAATALTTNAAKFDPKQFLALSYRSALTDEAEKNMRAAGNAHFPKLEERAEFYEKFIGIGIHAYAYDREWWLIFKSQMRLLRELNQRVVTLDEARAIYDAAEQEYAKEYAQVKETFALWLGWLQDELLVLQEGMNLAISPKGRDFLKYLIHIGQSEEKKRL